MRDFKGMKLIDLNYSDILTLYDYVKKLDKNQKNKKLLQNVKSIRNDNGENIFHILARESEEDFKKYAHSRFNLELLNEKNVHGFTPIDIFLSSNYSSLYKLRNNLRWLDIFIKQDEENRIPKPDWLEFKFAAMVNGVIENRPLIVDHWCDNLWKQGGVSDVEESLRSSRGQEFLTMVGEKYGHTLYPYNSNIKYGVAVFLNEWLCGKFKFFEMAKTPVEVRVALWEAWKSAAKTGILQDNEILTMDCSKLEYRKKLKGYIDNLTINAIELGIDVKTMKDDVLSGKRFIGVAHDTANKIILESSDTWSIIDCLSDRDKLLKGLNMKKSEYAKPVIYMPL